MSVESTTDKIMKRVQLILLSELPEPTCASEKEQWRWQVEQVKKNVAARLNPQSNGITINITP